LRQKKKKKKKQKNLKKDLIFLNQRIFFGQIENIFGLTIIFRSHKTPKNMKKKFQKIFYVETNGV
jgi:hypothetical protein